ncbi:MAG: type II toxin-antitoxin system HicA family toxin [Gemmatimonadaceae bacterium]
MCTLAECFGWTFDRSSGSHHIYKRLGDRRLMNFQEVRGMAKPYQVRQLLRAIDLLDDPAN